MFQALGTLDLKRLSQGGRDRLCKLLGYGGVGEATNRAREFWYRGPIRCNHGCAAAEGFQHRESQPFMERWEQDQSASLIKRTKLLVRHVASEAKRILD